MKRFPAVLALALACPLAASCAAGAVAPRPSTTETQILAEARRFMADYARELLAGDRAAIAARYDRQGAHLLRQGTYAFRSHAEIVERYRRPQWTAPAAFEWRDLAYEVAGPDAVVVVGRFVWTARGEPPEAYSYTALLRRQDGVLRIRVEDEAPDTSAPPSR